MTNVTISPLCFENQQGCQVQEVLGKSVGPGLPQPRETDKSRHQFSYNAGWDISGASTGPARLSVGGQVEASSSLKCSASSSRGDLVVLNKNIREAVLDQANGSCSPTRYYTVTNSTDRPLLHFLLLLTY